MSCSSPEITWNSESRCRKRSFSSSSASRNSMPRCRAIAVEQEEPAVRLARQHALDDRQDRGDAGAGGKADIGPRLVRRRRDAEAAGRRHHVELVAGLQFVGRPARERAAIDLLHGDAQLAVLGSGADRIGAADFLAVHGRAQRQILAGRKAVIVCKLFRDRKGQRHRVRVSRRRSSTARRWKRGAWDIVASCRHCEERSDEAIQLPALLHGLLRFARNDGIGLNDT